MSNERLTIRLPHRLMALLVGRAIKEKKTKSDLVREILSLYL
jgi:metal-responsive CopG/Arc/MetJ family transcriptional regulator